MRRGEGERQRERRRGNMQSRGNGPSLGPLSASRGPYRGLGSRGSGRGVECPRLGRKRDAR
eukprot:7494492-Pyramimonas_sp.AAC.1